MELRYLNSKVIDWIVSCYYLIVLDG